MMRTLQAGLLYFVLVFAAGFILGTVRVLWLAPHLGERLAELAEMPLMLMVIVVSAGWSTRRMHVPPTTGHRLSMGGLALFMLLSVEFSVVLQLRDLSIEAYIAGRDPVSGTTYAVMLLIYALMPLFVARVRPEP